MVVPLIQLLPLLLVLPVLLVLLLLVILLLLLLLLVLVPAVAVVCLIATAIAAATIPTAASTGSSSSNHLWQPDLLHNAPELVFVSLGHAQGRLAPSSRIEEPAHMLQDCEQFVRQISCEELGVLHSAAPAQFTELAYEICTDLLERGEMALRRWTCFEQQGDEHVQIQKRSPPGSIGPRHVLIYAQLEGVRNADALHIAVQVAGQQACAIPSHFPAYATAPSR